MKPLVPHLRLRAERLPVELDAVRAGRASAKHYRAAKARAVTKRAKAVKRTKREQGNDEIQAAMLRVMAGVAGAALQGSTIVKEKKA
jgi:hypothetical protein